jgi:hypothetical protein
MGNEAALFVKVPIADKAVLEVRQHTPRDGARQKHRADHIAQGPSHDSIPPLEDMKENLAVV